MYEVRVTHLVLVRSRFGFKERQGEELPSKNEAQGCVSVSSMSSPVWPRGSQSVAQGWMFPKELSSLLHFLDTRLEKERES